MEHIQEQSKAKRNVIYLFKIFLIISCSFISCFYQFKQLNILLIIPLFSFCFFTGIDFFLYSLIGFFSGAIVTYHSNTLYIALAICLFFIIFTFFRILKVKSIYNHTFSATLAVTLTYLSYQLLNHTVQIMDLAIILCFSFILSALFSFIIHTFPLKSVLYFNENTFIISALLLAFYFSFIPYKSIAIILIRLLFLLSAIKVSLKSTLALSAAYFLTMFALKTSFNESLFLMIIPSLAIGFIKEKKKWISILFYVVTSILFIFILQSNTLKYELIETAITTFILCLFPQSFLMPIVKEDSYYKMYLKNKEEFAIKLEEFSKMFKTLSNQFIKSKRSRILQQANIEVFDKLCANCFKNQYCHQNGNHLLINYVKDGILNNLNENKINYIKKNCLKADAYLKLIDNFMNSYLLKKFENDEICLLKEVVSNQFLGFSKILDQYKDSFLEDKLIQANSFYKNIKSYLQQYNYDILFVNNYSNEECYQFDIAIGNCKTSEIKEKILPIINSILKCQMEIIDIHMNNLVSNYLVLSIKEVSTSKIDVFYRQNSKEATHCGDSILTSSHLDRYYLGISDGMGNGIEANEESQFTLEALFSTIKTGMDIQEGIAITNSLLKLKNHYDTYTTIDLIEINKNNLIAKFYKAGSFLSIIKRGDELIVIENYALPIGIIDSIKIHPYEIQLQHHDIIYMMSDGIIDELTDEIEKMILNEKETNASLINRNLFEKLSDLKQIKDDATFAVIVIQ